MGDTPPVGHYDHLQAMNEAVATSQWFEEMESQYDRTILDRDAWLSRLFGILMDDSPDRL